MRTFLWTVSCVALGVVLASWHVAGRTPLDHVQRAWRQHVAGRPEVDRIKEKVGDALDDARDALSSNQKPREHHSDGDRHALDKLIARRSTSAHER